MVRISIVVLLLGVAGMTAGSAAADEVAACRAQVTANLARPGWSLELSGDDGGFCGTSTWRASVDSRGVVVERGGRQRTLSGRDLRRLRKALIAGCAPTKRRVRSWDLGDDRDPSTKVIFRRDGATLPAPPSFRPPPELRRIVGDKP